MEIFLNKGRCLDSLQHNWIWEVSKNEKNYFFLSDTISSPCPMSVAEVSCVEILKYSLTKPTLLGTKLVFQAVFLVAKVDGGHVWWVVKPPRGYITRMPQRYKEISKNFKMCFSDNLSNKFYAFCSDWQWFVVEKMVGSTWSRLHTTSKQGNIIPQHYQVKEVESGELPKNLFSRVTLFFLRFFFSVFFPQFFFSQFFFLLIFFFLSFFPQFFPSILSLNLFSLNYAKNRY